MTAVPPEAPAETDKRAIEATVREYFEGWYDGDTACAIVHTGTYHEYVQLIPTSAAGRIANALWQPSAG